MINNSNHNSIPTNASSISQPPNIYINSSSTIQLSRDFYTSYSGIYTSNGILNLPQLDNSKYRTKEPRPRYLSHHSLVLFYLPPDDYLMNLSFNSHLTKFLISRNDTYFQHHFHILSTISTIIIISPPITTSSFFTPQKRLNKVDAFITLYDF